MIEFHSKYLRMFTPLKKVGHSKRKRTTRDNEYWKNNGWAYAYVLGRIDDKKNEEGMDIL